MFDAEYTVTKLPFLDTLKSKLSGSAEDDAVLDTSSRRVRAGCACEEAAVGLDAPGRSS
jgi:hypothetical protein